MFEFFVRFGRCLCCLLPLIVYNYAQYFHGARPGAPTYCFDAEKRGWRIVHFDVLKSNMQEFGLNKISCLNCSLNSVSILMHSTLHPTCASHKWQKSILAGMVGILGTSCATIAKGRAGTLVGFVERTHKIRGFWILGSLVCIPPSHTALFSPYKLVAFVECTGRIHGHTPYLSGAVHNVPTRWVLALFRGFLNFQSHAPYRSLGGRMCMLF